LLERLSLKQVVCLDELLASGAPPPVAFPQAIGGTSVCDSIWRFFSDSWPQGGILGWNVGSSWKSHWQPFLPSGLFSFGEDVFGNQLVLVNGCDNALLWDHENGECCDLLVGPCELLRTALESGIAWIDFYSDGSLAIARQFGAVPIDMHLDWTTPLILNGRVSRDNVSLLERELHLVGHAQIWSQLSGLPPGTTVIPRSV
jgi:hypothetical protein